MSFYYWFSEVSRHDSEVHRGRLIGSQADWRGPVTGAYVYKDKPSVTVHFRDPGDRGKVSLAELVWIGTALQSYRGSWTGEVLRSDVLRGKIYLTTPVQSLAEIESQIRQARLDDEAEEARIQADPLRKLERELKGYDWYSHQSDDFSVWSAGEAAFRRIQEIASSLDPAVLSQARDLYRKYAPQGFTTPF